MQNSILKIARGEAYGSGFALSTINFMSHKYILLHRIFSYYYSVLAEDSSLFTVSRYGILEHQFGKTLVDPYSKLLVFVSS
jgi:hypothetical protein